MAMRCSLSKSYLRRWAFSLLLLGVVFSAHAQAESLTADSLDRSENPRLVAAALCVTLGPFGVHRMYLGTDVHVPVFYTLTLGGGMGILPLIDLGMLLFSKDLERLKNHPGVFLWTGRKKADSLESGAG
jgi:TM2 domain-containing membrane protein YozV